MNRAQKSGGSVCSENGRISVCANLRRSVVLARQNNDAAKELIHPYPAARMEGLVRAVKSLGTGHCEAVTNESKQSTLIANIGYYSMIPALIWGVLGMLLAYSYPTGIVPVSKMMGGAAPSMVVFVYSVIARCWHRPTHVLAKNRMERTVVFSGILVAWYLLEITNQLEKLRG